MKHSLPLSFLPAMVLLAGAWAPAQAGASLPAVDPGAEGFDPVKLARVGAVVEQAIKDGQAPGATVVVGRNGHVVYRLVAGQGSLSSSPEPLWEGAVFDMASLTKPMATATSVMILVAEGKVALSDPVCRFLPDFKTHGKDRITVEQLLRHRGGLLPDNPVSDYEEGPLVARRKIFELDLRADPGTKFIYTDVGYILLGWVVEKVSGQRLDRFAAEHIFQPLGMRDTRFLPREERTPPPYLRRCVPTEPTRHGEPPLRGQVHDPRARLLGGVAGHAGLFSTADDVARYATMMLDEGRAPSGPRILPPEMVTLMTSADDLPTGQRRGLGWDLGTSYSGPRGQGFSARSFGHTGFTGTSLWMDPATRTFVIILTSRLHPDGKGDVRALRREVATQVAAALKAEEDTSVLTGLDQVAAGRWPEDLAGRKVGLITNHTGVDRRGRRGIDILRECSSLDLAAIFSPEHGLEGIRDEKVGDGRDPASGLPVWSLYGDTRRPTPESLKGLQVLVFDIQDIGTRFYTYISTMVYALEEAAKGGLSFVVLDRPNAIGGLRVEGPVADAESLDFVGCLRLPIRHGLTVGEIARLAVMELGLQVDLRVVEMQGWKRNLLYDQTGLRWINPSPNMRSLDAALLYPGIGLLETTNLSVGRGTETPFELVGAPWLDGPRLVRELRQLDLPGLEITAARFTPDASVFRGQACSGIHLKVTDRLALEPVRTGLELALALRRLHAGEWKPDRYNRLLKHRATQEAVEAGRPLSQILPLWEDDLRAFREKRARVLSPRY